MKKDNDIRVLSDAASGMKRSWRRPVFIGLLIASVVSAGFLFLRGYRLWDWQLCVVAVTGMIAVYVLATGYTGKRM